MNTNTTISLPIPDLVVPLHQPRHRLKHLILASIVAVSAFIAIVVLVIHAMVAWHLAYPYVPPLESDPYQAKGLVYEEVVFPSSSGKTTVDSWFIPATLAGGEHESSRTVILSHGFGANREENWVPMYDLAELVHEMNYNVIMFDYGYASKRYPAAATWGVEESQQLLAVIDYAKNRGADEIIVWGFSMGGGTALQAALQSDHIDAMILDSLFLPSKDTLYANINQYVNLPQYPTVSLLSAILPLWTGTSFEEVPSEQILQHNYDIPIFIIHGTSDSKANYTIAQSIAEAQSSPQSGHWIIENGQHEMLFRKDPHTYIQKTSKFLSQVSAMHN